MSKISHTESLNFKDGKGLIFVNFSDNQGEHHAYIEGTKNLLKQLKEAQNDGQSLDILNIEGVVHVGSGKEPDEPTIAYIEHKYGQ